MNEAIARALRERADRLREQDKTPGGSEWGYVPTVLARLADEIEAGLDEQVAEAEDLRSRLRDARWLDGEEALRETEQVAHEAVSALDRATSIRCSIGPALFQRIEAAGFEPGTMNPVSWLIAEVERLREEAHERTRLATRQIVEEREQIVDLIEQHAGSVDDPRIAEELIKLTWMVEARAGSPPEAR
jgi:hypothetical protein